MRIFLNDINGLMKQKDVDEVINALEAEDWDMRWCAVRALGDIGDPRAVEPLINLLEGEDELVRLEYVRFEWVRLAVALARGDAELVRRMTAQSFFRAYENDHDDELMRRAVAEALGNIGESAVEPLINVLERALDDEDGGVCQDAVSALADIGGERVVEPLIRALEDENVRWCAVDALGNIGDPRAVEPLISLFKGEKWWWSMHQAVAEALGKIGESAVKPLIEALNDEGGTVRRAATEIWQDA